MLKLGSFYFLHFPETQILFNVFEEYNIEARFVGGCVRDAIFNKRTNDFDIAVKAPINDIISILERHDIKCIKTAVRYNSIIVIIGQRQFDVTSLRCDIKCKGRKCDTEIVGSFEEDARRRDFSINAIYVDINGRIFDFFEGIKCLEKRQVVFIGDPTERIKEDYLRILRYYRFAAILQDYKRIYSDIFQQYAHLISKLSIERIQAEVLKIINHTKMVNIMYEDKILNAISKNASIDNFNKLANYDASPIVRMCALFGFDVLLQAFKLSRIHKKTIKKYQTFINESLEYCAYKNDIAFTNDVMLLKFALYNIPIEKYLCPKQKIDFPVTYYDLPPQTPNASRILRQCEKWWVIHKCLPNKQQCLDYIKRYL